MVYGIVGIFALACLAVVVWALKTAPTCTCGRTECGGGCLRR